LSDAWARQFHGVDSAPHESLEAAETFIVGIRNRFREHPALSPVFDSRSLDGIPPATIAGAELLGREVRDLLMAGTVATPRPDSCEKLSVGSLPRFRDLDWRDLGVRRAGRACDDHGWTTKLRRPVDDKLEAYLRRSTAPAIRSGDALRFIVLVGERGSGKTRALRDAVMAVCPDAAVLLGDPGTPAKLAALLSARETSVELYRGQGPLIVWLDDLERFIPPDESGLTLRHFVELRAWPRRVLVLATAGGRAADLGAEGRRNSQSDSPGASGSLLDLVLAERFAEIAVRHRGLSSAVLDAAVAQGAYAASDASAMRLHGIGPYVLGADLLVRKLDIGRQSGAASQPRSGQAVADAALTWSACGIGSSLDRARLRLLWEKRFQDEPAEGDLDSGLAWAEQPVLGELALVQRDDYGYRGADLIVGARRQSLTKQECLTVLTLATPQEAAWVPYAARGHRILIDALQQFSKARHDIDTAAWFPFHVAMGHIWNALGDKDRATAAWEVGLKCNCMCAIAAVTQERLSHRDFNGATELLRKALDAGDGSVAPALAVIYRALGRGDDAVDALRCGARAGNARSAERLAWHLLVVSRRPSEAETAFDRALDLGWGDAWHMLSSARAGRGDYAGAIEACAKGAKLGDGVAVLVEARYLSENLDDPERALQVLQPECELENPFALLQAGAIAERLDGQSSDKAAQYYRRAMRLGNASAAHHLGHLVASRGESDEADHALGLAFEMGDASAAVCQAKYRFGRGDVEGALAAAQAGCRVGDGLSMTWAAEHLQRIGDADGAQVLWANVLASDDGVANLDAGFNHLEREDTVRAEIALLRADELGQPQAAEALEWMWKRLGEPDLAREAGLRARALVDRPRPN
jgi:tetratricopeptide (TPR) repeat protein